LIKYEVPKEVPHYECVVEYVCDHCCNQCGRVPCDQAARVGAAAEQLNASADAGGAAPQVAEAEKPAKRQLFWPALFGRK
jgi:hypothetical protein